jgi:hypothetical protein
VGGEIFSTRPDRPWVLPSLRYNRYRVIPGGKATGAWSWPPTPSNARVKERVELYLYSPSGPSWPVIGRTLPLPRDRGLKFRPAVRESLTNWMGFNLYFYACFS